MTEVDYKKIIQDFVKDNPTIPDIQFMLANDVIIEHFTGGMVNYVFKVSSKDGSQSSVIKYGEEKPRVSSDGFEHLSLERQVVEAKSLELMAQFLPGSAPKLYCYDKRHNMLALEELKDFVMLGDEIRQGILSEESARKVGNFLGNMHNKTHKLTMKADEWQKMEETYDSIGTSIKETMKMYGFLAPFSDKHPFFKAPDGKIEEHKKIIRFMEDSGYLKKGMDLYDKKECFIHADSHPGHFLLFKDSNRISVIDMELAFLSSPPYSIAQCLFCYPLHLFKSSEPHKTDWPTKQKEVSKVIKALVDAYLEESDVYNTEENKSELISQIALSTGIILFATVCSAEGLQSVLKISQPQMYNGMLCASRVMEKHADIKSSQQLSDALCGRTE